MWKRAAVAFFIPLLCVMMVLAHPVIAAAVTLPLSESGDYKLVLNVMTEHPMTGERMTLEGVTYNLYRVAGYKTDENGLVFAVLEEFKDYLDSYGPNSPENPSNLVDLMNEPSERLVLVSGALAAYVRDSGTPPIDPADTADTDKNGVVTFPSGNKNLGSGLYLALGDPVERTYAGLTWTFTPQPALIPIPLLSKDNSKWIFIINADAKVEIFPPPGMSVPIDVTVRKVWQGSGGHPGSVTVELLANGELVPNSDSSTVVLSEANNWSYTWSGLSSLWNWTVREKVPSGWQASYTQNGNDFTITNQPTPTNTRSSGGGAGRSTQRDTKLPYTGQLWRPVVTLSAAGVLLLLVGAVLFSRRERPEGSHE